MRFVLYGASGHIGQCVLVEALARGHMVTAVVRNPAKLTQQHGQLSIVSSTIADAAEVAQIVAGHDAVVSAVGPGPDVANNTTLAQIAETAAQALIAGMQIAGVHRLVVVGGAGNLEVDGGVLYMDTPQYSQFYRPASLAHRAALARYRASDLDWTFFSPASRIAPGQRTEVFRVGTDQLIRDAAGKSEISSEDYAVALLDELEQSRFVRQHMTAAY